LRWKQTDDNGCPHINVNNWHCSDCNQKVSQFGSFFDNYGGKVKTFIKVLYENDFLEDFLNSYLNRSQDSESDKNSRNIENLHVDI